MQLKRDVPWSLAAAGVGAAYFASAKVGLLLAIVDGTATPVWLPTGIAVASLLLFGVRVAPGIAVAAFLVNLPLGPSPVSAAVIAAGNTAAPLAAVGLLRLAGFRSVRELRHVVSFIFLGSLAAMTVSASVGATVLVADGSIPAAEAFATWWVWWAGDAMGVMAFAPLILVASDPDCWTRFRRRGAEAAVLLASTAVVTHLVFRSELRLLYLVFPFLVWAAMRFEQAGAATITTLVVVLAAIASTRPIGPFAEGTLLDHMSTLQVFNAGVAFTSFVLAGVVTERRRALDAVTAAGADLEERVRARTAELEEANTRLLELDAIKDSFMTAVSHELRTPLTVVRGIAETLKRDEIRANADVHGQLVERMSVNAQRLERLLADLLDLDRLRRGAIEPQRRATSLREIALSVLSTVDAPSHPINVTDEHVIAFVDRSQMERIIENLVMNAVKHTPEGTKIWVQWHATGDAVELVVDDDGPGVPPGLAEQIFEPFVLGETPDHAPGTGIGLSLVWRFAQAHGGRAWVEARRGGGASFHVLLPDALRHGDEPATRGRSIA